MPIAKFWSVSEEPSNAASEAFISACARLNDGVPDEGGFRALLTDDFHYEDRRRGHLMGRADAENFHASVASAWQSGAGIPQWQVQGVLAVRGERYAVIRYAQDYGNGMGSESLGLLGLDATLTRGQVQMDFDVDDLDAAVAELDLLAGP